MREKEKRRRREEGEKRGGEKERGAEKRGRHSRTQKGKELFNWQVFVLLETALSNSHQNGAGTKLATKMQFYRLTRADFMWVRNIPPACQGSKRTEPHSGSDHLEQRPLVCKKCVSQNDTNSGFFSTVKPQWPNSLGTSVEILTPLRDSYLWVLGFLMPFLCHLRAMWKTRQLLKLQLLPVFSICISFFLSVPDYQNDVE